MARRGPTPDVLAALSTLLLAVLFLCHGAASPTAVPDLRTDGATKEADPSTPDASGDPSDDTSDDLSWDDPEPPAAPYPYRNGSRPHGQWTRPPAGRTTPPAPEGNAALSLSHGRPTAHAPPSGPLGQRPAARPAVLQVFRL
ncbi:hypothetical protein [Streptomyces sp. 8N706]|uniref:hypothetical protein n=1 Tax=Streptomyces sp. 8N706 TaxID=3457416 RepID=UPI003FD68B25